MVVVRVPDHRLILHASKLEKGERGVNPYEVISAASAKRHEFPEPREDLRVSVLWIRDCLGIFPGVPPPSPQL
jgi:hypothetical protein